MLSRALLSLFYLLSLLSHFFFLWFWSFLSSYRFFLFYVCSSSFSFFPVSVSLLTFLLREKKTYLSDVFVFISECPAVRLTLLSTIFIVHFLFCFLFPIVDVTRVSKDYIIAPVYSTPCDHTTYNVVLSHTAGCDSFTDIFARSAPLPYSRSYGRVMPGARASARSLVGVRVLACVCVYLGLHRRYTRIVISEVFEREILQVIIMIPYVFLSYSVSISLSSLFSHFFYPLFLFVSNFTMMSSLRL